MTATRLVRPVLFDQVVSATYEYLGPAADRFITRQVRNHLHKEPEQLEKRDLLELIDWIKLAMAFLSNDDILVDNYIKTLRRLAGSNGTTQRPKLPKRAKPTRPSRRPRKE
jgi:hypothetical protein